MNLLERLSSFIILLSVFIGIYVGQFEAIRTNADRFILPLLVGMLFITFLQTPLEKITNAFRNRKFTYTSILINFIWTPIIAGLLALLLLNDHPALYIGFLMLMVTPCTDWYLIFTNLAKGNIALSTAILPLNLFLQVILLPIYLFIFAGKTGIITFSFLIESVIIVLALPLFFAFFTKVLLTNKQQLKSKLEANLNLLPIVFLNLVIIALFAANGPLLLTHLDFMWILSVPILIFFVVNFVTSQKIGQLMRFRYPERASLSLTTLARNSPIALAIAMTAFPDQPLIALALIIGPLLELPVLAIISQLLLLSNKKSTSNNVS